MNRAGKIVWPASVLVIVGLVAGTVALVGPSVVPFLPRQAQVALGGSIDTVPSDAAELLQATDSGDAKVTHAHVDEEYVLAASMWPWSLPPGWSFPRNRGVADIPGHHYDGMGVRAAFSLWASASLDAVKAGDLPSADANLLLDEVEEATQILLDAGLLSDRRFIERSVTPLRSTP